jgi:hypothetical protein
MSYIKTIGKYKKAYTNWIGVILNVLFKRRAFPVILRCNNQKYNFSIGQLWQYNAWSESTYVKENGLDCRIDIFFNFSKLKEIPYYGRNIKMNGLEGNGDIGSVFIKEEYKFLNVENETVIDIGANIGDSAIYFILNSNSRSFT